MGSVAWEGQRAGWDIQSLRCSQRGWTWAPQRLSPCPSAPQPASLPADEDPSRPPPLNSLPQSRPLPTTSWARVRGQVRDQALLRASLARSLTGAILGCALGPRVCPGAGWTPQNILSSLTARPQARVGSWKSCPLGSLRAGSSLLSCSETKHQLGPRPLR